MSEATTPEPRPLWRRPLVTIPISLAFLAILYLILYAIAKNVYDDALQRATDAGLPTALTDIIPEPIPDDQNAAVDLWALYSGMLTTHPLATAILDYEEKHEAIYRLSQPGGPHDVTLAKSDYASLLDELAAPPFDKLYATAERMADKPAFVAPLNYRAGKNMSLTHLGRLRNMAKMLAFRAWLHAQSGNAEAATHDLQLIHNLAQHLQAEPVYISGLVTLSLDGIATSATKAIMRDTDPHAFTPDQLTRLIDALQSRRHPHDNAILADGIDGEYATFVADMQQLIDTGSLPAVGPGAGTAPTTVTPFFVLIKPLIFADVATGTDRFIALREQALLPHREAIATELTETPSTSRNILSNLLTNLLRTSYRKYTLHEANLAVTQAGLIVLRHHHQHGAYPTAEQLATIPDWPTDPFTTKPLNYQQTDTGYLITCQPDFQDPDGPHAPITWQLPTPPREAH